MVKRKGYRKAGRIPGGKLGTCVRNRPGVKKAIAAAKRMCMKKMHKKGAKKTCKHGFRKGTKKCRKTARRRSRK